MSHKRASELKERNKYLQYQKEMEEMQDRPCISDKSRELAMSNLRYKKPLYSPERYPLEIENYWNKRNEAIKRKIHED